MYKILVIAECINKDATSEGICTSNFLNALDTQVFKTDCLYYQLVQHELKSTKHIQPTIRLIKIENTLVDHLIQWARILRNRLNKHFGYDLLRNRRSFKIKSELKKVLLNESYDLIFVRTVANSIASHQAILELSKDMKLPPWIVNFNDPVPSSMMPYPYNQNQNTFKKKLKNDENLVRNIIQSANGITSPSVLLTKRFLAFYKLTKARNEVFDFPHVYHPIVEFDFSLPVDQEKLTLVHAGSLMKERNPRFLINALENVSQRNEAFRRQVKMIFLGNIHSDHLPILSDYPYSDMIQLINRRVPHGKTMGLIKRAQVLIILEAISDESPFMPAKLAEYIGLNRMIWSLSPEASETRRILGKSHYLQSRTDDQSRLESQLEWIFANWKNEKSFDLNRADLAHYVSSDHVNEELQKAIIELTSKSIMS